MEYLTKDYLLSKLIYLDIANYRRMGKLTHGKYLHEPTGYYNDLLEIYGQLSKENIIKLLKLKPKSEMFREANADIF